VQMTLEAANKYEAVLWFTLAGILVLRALMPRRRITGLGAFVVIILVLFGFSDLVESKTGAWWSPWWLFLWKAFCAISLALLVTKYYKGKSQP